MESYPSNPKSLRWEISVPIMQPTILSQITLRVLMPTVLLFAAISFVLNFPFEFIIVASIVVLLEVLVLLAVFNIYGWNYDVVITMDTNGVTFVPKNSDTKQGKTIRFLTLTFGIFSRKPGVTAAGMLTSSTAGEAFLWGEIRGIDPKEAQNLYEIKLSGSRRSTVFCHSEQFALVGERMQDGIDAWLNEVEDMKTKE